MPEGETGPEAISKEPTIEVKFDVRELETLKSLAEAAGVSPEQWAITAIRQRMHGLLQQETELGIIHSESIPDTIEEMWKDNPNE